MMLFSEGRCSLRTSCCWQPSFVFAEFEDGHVSGAMLLEYEVLDGGRISWKRLWSRLNGADGNER